MSLDEMKNIDIRTVDASTLVDRRSIYLDPNLSQQEKLREYIRKIKNPYCYLDGDVVVKVSFSEENVTLEERLEAYIRSL